MLKIRLQRVGRKHDPSFRVVLTDSRNAAKRGLPVEVLGYHDARKDNAEVKADRIQYWLSKGAQVSDTVHNLLITKKIISGKKINVLPKKTVPLKAEETAASPTAETPSETPVDAPVE